MHVLVTWGSEAGGTEEIGRVLAEELERHGFEVTARPANTVGAVAGYDAAIIGGALRAGLWHKHAYGFATRNMRALRRIPVWLFSSGPLDGSAETEEIKLPEQLSVLAERLGAIGHTTFGGRLCPDAKGFPAAAMAKERAGDWRNFERVRAQAADLARQLPRARPAPFSDPPARALWRLIAYGLAGWVLGAAIMGGLRTSVGTFWAIVLHVPAAPVIFWLLSKRYFRPRGAREPFVTALTFTGIVVVLDAVLAFAVLRRPDMLAFVFGTWLPPVLIFATVYLTGLMRLVDAKQGPRDDGPAKTA